MSDVTRVAVLIDCDNISHQWARAILGEVAKHGTLGIKRGYGDWTDDHLKNWRPVLATYATTVEVLGDVGAGQVAKLINNAVSSVTLARSRLGWSAESARHGSPS